MEKICYFCGMNEFNVYIITKGEDLPQMRCTNFFHSVDLFRIIEKTPGQKPLMAVAYNTGGKIVGHLMVMLRRRGSFIPPYLFTQARIYGEGEYNEDCDKETVFGLMLQKIVRKLKYGTCLYIEFSDISTKMFGYAKFRTNGFFPIHWLEIHNSLHSMAPENRLTQKMKKQLTKAKDTKLVTNIATTEKEFTAFFKLLRGYVSLKIRRFIPDQSMFHELKEQGVCDLFVTKYEGKIVSGCICVYSQDNCYLWYLATKQKIYKKRANALTVWTAIKNAYENRYRHIYFMDVGLPFKKNPFRDFILGFGGKPVGKYRWFRFSFRWLNTLLSWCYRE